MPNHKPAIVRTSTMRELVNPVDYDHRFDSMARFADLLALCYDSNRTRHAYTTGGWEASGETAHKCSPEPTQGETNGSE